VHNPQYDRGSLSVHYIIHKLHGFIHHQRAWNEQTSPTRAYVAIEPDPPATHFYTTSACYLWFHTNVWFTYFLRARENGNTATTAICVTIHCLSAVCDNLYKENNRRPFI
jgi:hypothetical protein